MRGSEPKIHLCHWQGPLENIKLHTSDPEAEESREVPPFHLHKDFQNRFERTDTTRDLDCYTFGTFIWIMCEGSFAHYPINFQQYTDYEELKQALGRGIVPESPGGKMVDELEEHQLKLYELMKFLWTQPETYTMEIANDRLAFLTGSRRNSGQFHMFFEQE
jgi:hypothetical protein